MLLSDNKLLLSGAGRLFVAAVSVGRHWTVNADAYILCYFGNYNVLGKYKLFYFFLVSILRNIQVYSSWGRYAQQQKKASENSLIRKKQERKASVLVIVQPRNI